MKTQQSLGAWGESKVADHLQQQGYTIVARRYQTRQGEIDLIVQKGPYLAFVEVKLRKDNHFASAMESVHSKKQGRLIRAALSYLEEQGPAFSLQPRFDVAEVYAPQGQKTLTPEIYYLENAFETGGGRG